MSRARQSGEDGVDAQDHDVGRRRVLTYPEFVLALRAGALEGSGTRPDAAPPHACAACGRLNASGIVVRHKGSERCPACIPRRRRCARCEQMQPVETFDVPAGRRVDSYCGTCRRVRQNRYYHAVQRGGRKIPPAEATCTKCLRTMSSDNFQPDQRYKHGIYNVCRECHNG